MDLRPEASELLGTFLVVAVGGAAVAAGAGAVGVALAFGLAVLALVYALAPVGGAHFNPAITVAFAVTRHFPWRRVPTYAAAQLVGATAAAALLHALAHAPFALATTLPPGGQLWHAFAGEGLLTAFLAIVILSCATHAGRQASAAGLAIGLAVAAGSMTVGAFSGASMNPARSLGPALVEGSYGMLAVDVAGSIAGAVLGMAAFELIRAGRTPRAVRAEVLGVAGPVELEATR